MEAKQNWFTIGDDGTVNIPPAVLAKYGLKSGDEVGILETEFGLILGTRQQIVNQLLDQIGEGLKSKGITLEQLMADGRKIRDDILREEYGIEAGDDD